MTDKQLSGAETVSWDLTDLYAGADDPQINADLDACDAAADALDAAYRGRIADLTAAELAAMIVRYEALVEQAHKVGSFASLNWTQDTQDPARGALLCAEVTIVRPHLSWARSFDVLVGTPADLARADADTRHHAGTVSFFGHLSHGGGVPMEATFAVPLPRRPEVFGAARVEGTPLHVRVLPSSRRPAAAPTLVRAAIHAR